MSPLSAVALLVLCATPSLTSPSGFHQTSSFSNGYQAVAASNSAPVIHTRASYKGCSSANGCGSVTLENGKITESSGNPVALGLTNGESPETLDPSELHKKFALQAENIKSAFGANLPINGPLWWMGKDSPFKDSFEAYQKFVNENGLTIPQFPSPCGTPSCPFGNFNDQNKISGSGGGISNSIDIASNPFLNGQFGSAAGFSSSSGSAAFDSSKNPFLNGNINLPAFGNSEVSKQQTSSSFEQTQTGCGNGGSGCGFQDQQQVVSGFGQVQTNCNGPFCGQEQQVLQPFPRPIPSIPPPQPIPNIPPPQPIPNIPPPQPIPNKPPQPGLPHPPGATAGGFKNNEGGTSGELTVTCTGQGYICVDKSLCLNGYVNDNGENILQARSGVRCKASSEVCCRFKQKDTTQTTAQAYNNIQSTSKLQSGSFHSSGSSGLIHVPGSPNENAFNNGNTGFNIQGSKQTNFGQTGYDQQTYNNYQAPKSTNQINTPFVSSGQAQIYQDSDVSQTQDQYYQRPTFGNSVRPGTPYLPPEDTPNKPYVYPEPKKPFNPVTERVSTIYVAPTTRPTTRYVPPTPTRYIPPTPTRPAPIPTTGRPYLPPKEDERPQSSSGSQQIVARPIQENEGGILLDETRNQRPQQGFTVPVSAVPSACAAALKCTAIEFCTADGMISNTTVVLTRGQQEFRVPMTDCREPSTGLIGKCCRDPTYTDPWPTNQLGRWIPEAFGDTGAYRAEQHRGGPRPVPVTNTINQRIPDIRPTNGGFGSNPAGSINNPIYAVNPNQRPINPSVQLQKPVNPGAYGNTNQQKTQSTFVPNTNPSVQIQKPVNPGVFVNSNQQKPQSTFVPNSQVNTQNLHSTGELILSNFAQGNQQNVKAQVSGTCGARRTGTRPFGNKDQFEADFAEIPWQAMVLLQTNRSLLCGGVITAEDIVVTSAHCIDGLEAKNVLIKGGEWKLGIDEEPLPFQIVQVAKIYKHPEYFTGSLQNDFAILVLAEKLRFAANIEPICLPPANQNADARLYKGSGYQCITTGWGKQVLQINIPNSIMHTIDMNLIPPQQCQAQITQNYPHLLENYNPNTCICGQPGVSNANVCKVDIGSALACTDGSGVYYMEGVYSWDSGCTSPNQLASFYKFDSSWYHSAISGQTDVQSQLYQNQQFVGGNNGAHFNAQAQAQRHNEQQAQYSTQYKQVVHKQGQSYAVNGAKAFEQAINGHVHAGGAQCQCYEEGK